MGEGAQQQGGPLISDTVSVTHCGDGGVGGCVTSPREPAGAAPHTWPGCRPARVILPHTRLFNAIMK